MKYPIIKIDGKPIKIDKGKFDLLENKIKGSITFDNNENDLGLTKKDIGLLSWNCAVMVYLMCDNVQRKQPIKSQTK